VRIVQTTDELPGLYTTAQLSRILKVPERRIRTWVRMGLIRPARTSTGGAHFDFRQMTELRLLRELTDEGVSVSAIRRGLAQLERWLPEGERTVARLTCAPGDGRLLIRDLEGRVAEASGQLRLAFPADADPDERVDPVALPDADPGPTAEEWFEAAIEFEEGDRPEEAEAAYAEAMVAGSDRTAAAFNRGNVLFTLGRLDDAVACFHAALREDPRYLEAWNNLASAELARGEWQSAVEAACRAVDLDRDYADAHFNLAQAYLALGRRDEARRHARTYLRFDPTSEWAERLRADLGLP